MIIPSPQNSLVNKSTGSQTYTCTFEGGSPETYTQKDPGYIIFSKPSPTRHQINIICFIQ